MNRSLAAWSLALALASGGAGPARGDGGFFQDLIQGRFLVPRPTPVGDRVLTGFNQAWLHDDYGSQWTLRWDEDEAARMVRATRQLGGRILRVWLFEGLDHEGVRFLGGRAAGLDPDKLDHLERFLELCEAEGVQAYLTLFDGNGAPPEDPRRAVLEGLLADRDGAGAAYRERVLAPVLGVASRHPGAVYGVDLINEGNALVRKGWFPEGWRGATRFVRTWRDFVRARLAVPVTMSFGHHFAVDDMLSGALPREVVDLYDVHVYSDEGRVPRAAEVRRLAATTPVILGEYGQAAPRFDDRLQVRVVEGFLSEAHRLGLRAALAWRLSDVRPGYNAEARFSFEAYAAWRPAAATHRTLSALP